FPPAFPRKLRKARERPQVRSWRRVIDEMRRHGIAPLRAVAAGCGAVEMRLGAGVEPVAIGHVLMHAAPGIGPVVEDLAAIDMPARSPDRPIFAEAFHVLV